MHCGGRAYLHLVPTTFEISLKNEWMVPALVLELRFVLHQHRAIEFNIWSQMHDRLLHKNKTKI